VGGVLSSFQEKKYIIRGTKEGLWFEVLEISERDNPEDIIMSGKVVASFEIDYSKERGKFILKRILFEKSLTKDEKVIIMETVRDFVESLNAPD